MTVALAAWPMSKAEYSPDGIIRWTQTWYKTAINDGAPGIQRNTMNELFDIGQVVITKVTVFLEADTSGSDHPWEVRLAYSRGYGAYNAPIGKFVTSALADSIPFDCNDWDCWVPLDDSIRTAPTTTYIVTCTDLHDPATGHANDTIWIRLEGLLLPRDNASAVNPIAQPVSLEGYKWPLVRR